MFTLTRTDARGNGSLGLGASVAATLALLSISAAAYCQDLQNLAPPIQSDQATSAAPADSTAGNQDNVFNWNEVPLHQDVPITRATFDKSGYQLYDTKGEIILVPFKDDNLKVMKFGVSDNGAMYFRKDNCAPVLYVPEGGYLENASVQGARWYPFTSKFHPDTAVYLDMAPTYTDYCDMYWEPDMYCYGGYWCNSEVGIFTPCFGFFFDIGGYPYWGWGGYRGWWHWHPYGYRVGFFDHGFYGRGFYGGHPFGGGFYAHRSFGGGFGGGHVFRGVGGGFGGHAAFGGGGGHVFRGATGSFGGGHFGGGGGSFGGGHFGGGGGSFGGGHFDGGSSHFGGGGGGGHFGGGGGGGHHR